MKHLIDPYLEYHETAWAPTTYNSEKSRLRALGEKLTWTPEAAYRALSEEMKPYTVKNTFIRIVALEKWAHRQGHIKGTPFAEFMYQHRNRFKHVYQKEELEITPDDARRKIEGLAEPYRTLAMDILATGLRISEAYTASADRVVGKGGKTRRVYGDVNRPLCSKTAFRSALRDIGLKPHTLRKLRATELAERGASAADLCKIFGWSSISTAYIYLQSRDEDRLAELMK